LSYLGRQKSTVIVLLTKQGFYYSNIFTYYTCSYV